MKTAAASAPVRTCALVTPGGKARVTLTPASAPIVVPGGTFGLLIVCPAAMPVALATVAALEFAVVVSVVFVDPQIAKLNWPVNAKGALGPTAVNCPETTAFA